MMKENAIREIVPLLKLTTGQRIVVLNQMRRQAVERGLTDVVQRIDRALDHESATRTLENRWSSKRKGPDSGKVAAVDDVVDRNLSGIRDVAAGQARGLPAHDPVTIASTRLLQRIFPHGVAAVTSLRVVDQVAAVEVILHQLQHELQDEVELLGLQIKVARLAAFAVEYRRVVQEHNAVDFAQVSGARDRGHDHLRAVLGMVIGRYADGDDAEHVAARDAMLTPVLIQMEQQRTRARARRRGRPLDELDLANLDDAFEPTDAGDEREPAETGDEREPTDEVEMSEAAVEDRADDADATESAA